MRCAAISRADRCPAPEPAAGRRDASGPVLPDEKAKNKAPTTQLWRRRSAKTTSFHRPAICCRIVICQTVPSAPLLVTALQMLPPVDKGCRERNRRHILDDAVLNDRQYVAGS